MKKQKQKGRLFFKTMFPVVKFFHKRQKVSYAVTPDEGEPAVFVANHAQAFGPMSMVLNFDRQFRPWIAGDIMDREKAKDFIFLQFFAGNLKKHKKWTMLKSKFVAKILVPIFENVKGIPVQYGSGIIGTFRETTKALSEGDNIVIFGEKPVRFSPYIAEISDGIFQVAVFYYKQTGKRLKIYPVYIGPHDISVGVPTEFDPEKDMKVQRQQMAEYIKLNIHELASALPEHKPIPTYTDEYLAAVEKEKEDAAEKKSLSDN